MKATVTGLSGPWNYAYIYVNIMNKNKTIKKQKNKKVLLREHKRHTDCHVASTPSVVLPRYPPSGPGQGGYPAWGVPCLGGTLPGGYPAKVPPLSGPGEVPPSIWTWRGTPPSGPGWRVPCWGVPCQGTPPSGPGWVLPIWTWLRGTLLGYPHLDLAGCTLPGYPPSGTGRVPPSVPGQGVPCWGVACQGIPPLSGPGQSPPPPPRPGGGQTENITSCLVLRTRSVKICVLNEILTFRLRYYQ